MPGVKLKKEGEGMSKITYDINDLSALKCAYFLKGYLFDHHPQIHGRIKEIISVLECHADFKDDYTADHDGCEDCEYESHYENEIPCMQCKQNYTDKWVQKEGDD